MTKKIQIFNNVSDGVPELSLIGDIGMYDAETIAKEIGGLRNLSLWGEHKLLRLRINSYGGSIMAAYTIIEAMNTYYQNGGQIETINSGRADSAAGWIFAFGTRELRKIMPFAGMAFHPPILKNGLKMNDLPEDDPRRIQMKEAYKNLRDIFKAATGIKEDDIKKIMDNEMSLTADQAVSLGFADEKVRISNMPSLKNNMTPEEFVNCTQGLDFDIVNEKPENGISINNKKSIKMSKILSDLLNLQPEASEGAKEQAVKNLISEHDSYKEKYELENKRANELKAELDELKSKFEAQQNKDMINYIDKVIELDPTKKDKKDILLNMAKVDFESFKLMNPLKDEKGETVDITNGMQPESGSGAGAEGKDNAKEEGIKNAKEFYNLTLSDKEKLQKEDPTKYDLLRNSYDNHSLEIF